MQLMPPNGKQHPPGFAGNSRRLKLAALAVLWAVTINATPDASNPSGAQITRLSNAGLQMFFGYYDVAAVDHATGRHLAHRVDVRDRLPTAEDEAELGFVSLDGEGKFTVFARTKAWNFQQGAMLQWVGDGSGRVFFNEAAPDCRRARGVLLDIESGVRTYTDRGLVDLSDNGQWGLSVDFGRLYDFRPGYGYAIHDDPRQSELHPRDDGVWVCDLATGESKLVVSLAALHARVGSLSPFMQGKLLVNHLTFNPSASRFVFLLRNFPIPDAPRTPGSRWRTTVLTAARDGSDIRILVPPGYASHYHWRDDSTIVFHCDGPQGRQLYEITDVAKPTFTAIDPGFFLRDGHCSYSADRRWMLYDTYPDENRQQHLVLYDLKERRGWTIGSFRSETVPIIDLRCDLHPRWLPDGRISFDSTHERFRGIYIADVRSWILPSGR
jgi:hypothetical protein